MIVQCKIATREGRLIVLSPALGIWSQRPAIGRVVLGGQSIGVVELLGRRQTLILPERAHGAIVGGLGEDRRRDLPIDYGAELLHLDPEVGGAALAGEAAGDAGAASGLGYPSPSSGRFWRRPSPGDPPLIEEGQLLEKGHPVGLLEVMKTFTRLTYEGPGLPDRARVIRIVPADGEDVDAGDILVDLEPA
jgi:acetyl-CoA carboxylase biotin carboxyl carrier protein